MKRWAILIDPGDPWCFPEEWDWWKGSIALIWIKEQTDLYSKSQAWYTPFFKIWSAVESEINSKAFEESIRVWSGHSIQRSTIFHININMSDCKAPEQQLLIHGNKTT